MNTTKKCSISGIAFVFEADAYESLSGYLAELREQYRQDPDGEEIIADIEARIAELILSTQDNGRTVGLPLVKNIIAQMGSAAEIESESNPSTEPSTNGSKAKMEQPRIPRRLYRDAEAGKLGGVCAGLGNYFDIDPVWVRLLIFLPLAANIIAGGWMPYWIPTFTANLFGVFVLCYLVLWFSIPAARTARQKLEMKGEKITAESIREKTSSAKNDVDGRARAAVASTVSTFGQVVQVLLKLIMGAILLGMVITAGGLLIGLFALLFDGSPALQSAEHWVAILGVLTLLMPALLIIYILLCLLASRRPHGKGVGITFVVWVLVALAMLILAVRSDLPRAFWYKSLPTPTFNQQNLLNDASTQTEEDATFEEIMRQHEETLKKYEEELKKHEEALKQHEKLVEQHTQTIKQTSSSSQGGTFRITTPEGEVRMEADQNGVRINVTEREE